MTNTENIGKPEIVTQKRVIKFFQDTLEYKYIGNLSDKENSNVDEQKLKQWLSSTGKYSEIVINNAVKKFQDDASYIKESLYRTNQNVYTHLRYGVQGVDDENGNKITVQLIDWDTIGNNLFEIAEEVTVKKEQEKRPDLVIYVNGIALAVIELKRSSVSIENGVRQNLTNQKAQFIDKFFTTIQFCMAGNDTEGLKYGTIETDAKDYLEWKDDNFKEFPEERDEIDIFIEEKCQTLRNKLDKALFAMFQKTRFLRLNKDFIIFDSGKKKVCRYNQYFAIMRAQKRLSANKGGIIWHTQGSGKTLTMVWLAKWILSNLNKARVLIVTDREELDENIENTFKGVNLTSIKRTKTCKDLIDRLNAPDDSLMCSLIHKFGRRGNEESEGATEKDLEKYAQDILDSLPDNFSVKDNMYVFVDECHRTHSGKLHLAMEKIMPNAVTIGFTGTPLLKKDKKTSLEIFGKYIHTYKYNEGVRDGVVLDLRYEARDIEQRIKSQAKVDAWFEAQTSTLSERAKNKLKERWGTLQKIYSSSDRLEQIATDIQLDFATKNRLKDGSGTAILAADSIYSACRYYEIFKNKGFKECFVISSYEPNYGNLRTESVSVDDETTEEWVKFNTYLKMIGIDNTDTSENIQKKLEDKEKEAKEQFIKEPAKMKLLIVVNKLLTGFNAPPCTYLYIDRKMEDQNLFQAVCRVNRLDGETKDFGFIIDYKKLFEPLCDAMNKYTTNAFENFDENDIDGLLKNRKIEAEKYFNEILDTLKSLCEGVPLPQEPEDYYAYFSGEFSNSEIEEEIYAKSRDKLYLYTNKLHRAYLELKPYMAKLEYSQDKKDLLNKEVTFFEKLSLEVAQYSGDYLDLKNYEHVMRRLIDDYVTVDDSIKLGNIDDFTLLDFIDEKKQLCENSKTTEKTKRTAAESIENNIRKKIVEKKIINPKYYEEMSVILQNLIEEQKKSAESYSKFLDKYAELAKKILHPEDNEKYPEQIRKSEALRTLYDNISQDTDLVIKIHNAVLDNRQDGFRTNQPAIQRIKRALFGILQNKDEVERVYDFIGRLKEY